MGFLNPYVIRTKILLQEMWTSGLEWDDLLINTELKLIMKSRDKLKNAAVKNKSSSLMEDYRKVRNRVNSLNSLLKQQYFINKISENRGNMKECWKKLATF